MAHRAGLMGWTEGFEPSISWATTRCLRPLGYAHHEAIGLRLRRTPCSSASLARARGLDKARAMRNLIPVGGSVPKCGGDSASWRSGSLGGGAGQAELAGDGAHGGGHLGDVF